MGSIRNTALNLLARREHSAFELKNKLKKKGFPESEIDGVIATLIKENLQSDKRFTESYVRARRAKGFGPLRIELELKERGVGKAIIVENLQLNDGSWFDDLSNLYHKKYGHISTSTGDQRDVEFSEKAKQIRFLQYRGFSLEKIHEVVK